MSINENGFLSDDVKNWTGNYQNKYKQYFQLYKDYNLYAQKILHQLTIHNNDVDELLISCLYIRSLSSYQSLYLLLEKGIVHESKIILRSLMEVLFELVAINNNGNFSEKYINQDLIHRKKLINKLSKLGDCRNSLALSKLKDSLSEIENQIKKNNVKELKTYNFAEKAGLLDFYHSAYALLSLTVHISPRDLQNHLVINNESLVTSFNLGPSDEGMDRLLISGVETIHIILSNVINKFKMKKDINFTTLELRYKELQNKYRSTHQVNDF